MRQKTIAQTIEDIFRQVKSLINLVNAYQDDDWYEDGTNPYDVILGYLVDIQKDVCDLLPPDIVKKEMEEIYKESENITNNAIENLKKNQRNLATDLRDIVKDIEMIKNKMGRVDQAILMVNAHADRLFKVENRVTVLEEK